MEQHGVMLAQDKPFACDSCGEAFNRKGNLERHKAVIHAGLRYECPVCDKQFHSDTARRKHVAKHYREMLLVPSQHGAGSVAPSHPQDISRPVAQPLGHAPNATTSSFRLLVPQAAGGVGTGVGVMASMGQHTGAPSAQSSAALPPPQPLGPPRRPIKDGRYRCSQCDYTTNQDWYLKRHELSHAGNKPFNCDVCGVSFSRKANLDRHRNIVHEGIRYPCPVCDKQLTTEGHLRAHMNKHNGYKPYKCSYCEATFYRSDRCRQHEKKNHQDRVFVCESCGEAFNRKGNLDRHKAILHAGLRYSCNVCEKPFHSDCARRKHVSQHCQEMSLVPSAASQSMACSAPNCQGSQPQQLMGNAGPCAPTPFRPGQNESYKNVDLVLQAAYGVGVMASMGLPSSGPSGSGPQTPGPSRRPIKDGRHRCSQCDYSTNQEWHLKRHELSHSGDKPFSCDVCGSSFSRKANLDRHRNIAHEGVRYPCPVCDKQLTTEGHLRAHMNKHSGYKPYKCSYCEATFYRVDRCRQHEKKNHLNINI